MTKYHITSVRLSDELKNKIKRKALSEDRSISNTINILIKDSLDRETKKGKKCTTTNSI